MIQDCHLLNWFFRSTIVRTRSSTADLATNKEWADKTPLIAPYAIPLRRRIRGVLQVRGLRIFRSLTPMMMTATRIAWPIIQIINWRRPSRASNWSRVCASSPIAPNIAMSTAPPKTSTVPPSDQRVKGSPRIRLAQMELNTRPD